MIILFVFETVRLKSAIYIYIYYIYEILKYSSMTYTTFCWGWSPPPKSARAVQSLEVTKIYTQTKKEPKAVIVSQIPKPETCFYMKHMGVSKNRGKPPK